MPSADVPCFIWPGSGADERTDCHRRRSNRFVIIGLAFLTACASAGATTPRARVDTKPVACSGHGVLDAGDCLCFPGYEGENCDATGGAFAKALLALQDLNESNAWIRRARQECCTYVSTLTVAAVYGELPKLDALLVGHPLPACDVHGMSSPMAMVGCHRRRRVCEISARASCEGGYFIGAGL